ncbi:MAG: T9SS type A sorting domain-containing protein [Bacteroidia bacterium]|jgi:hypothetical protein|nr:T9SS type A sorting domain-containing protein [Bacteroidia bacterium]
MKIRILQPTALVVLLIVSLNQNLNAQQGTLSSGNDITGAGGSISESIGQTNYVTLSSNTHIITQGLQQTYILIEETSLESIHESVQLKVYPNPTNEFVILEFENYQTEKILLKITDLSGKLLFEEVVNNAKTKIDLKNFANGKYQLSLILNNLSFKTYNIIKTQ